MLQCTIKGKYFVVYIFKNIYLYFEVKFLFLTLVCETNFKTGKFEHQTFSFYNFYSLFCLSWSCKKIYLKLLLTTSTALEVADKFISSIMLSFESRLYKPCLNFNLMLFLQVKTVHLLYKIL